MIKISILLQNFSFIQEKIKQWSIFIPYFLQYIPMINIVLFGAPGAGKGLQSNYLLQQYPLKHIAPGNIFREEIKRKSTLGKILSQYMSQGNLVPEQIVIETVSKTLQEAHAQNPTQCFLFDGYPRSQEQAIALHSQLKALQTYLHLFILLEVDQQTIQNRLAIRRDMEGRDDDHEQKIAHRLSLYKEYSQPIIHYYQDIIVNIQGTGTPEKVRQRIRTAIEQICQSI